MDFPTFITTYSKNLSILFKEKSINVQLTRGIESDSYDKIMELSPLRVFIPAHCGGFGSNTSQGLAFMEANSYESLALSLIMGINAALFIHPITRYAERDVSKTVMARIIKDKLMGGIMITEPNYGSDALKMTSSFCTTKNGTKFRIEGTKHWAGLTGSASYWLIAARKKKENNELGRDISFFIHDSRNGGIEVIEYYNSLGLYLIPYGRNKINIEVPNSYKIAAKPTGLKVLLDILHRSRLLFPGLGMGFLRRIMDEAIKHCQNRIIGNTNLSKYDQVKKRLSNIQTYFTTCSAMCYFSSSYISLAKDTSHMNVEANSIKAILTDYMQEAAQSLLQLFGAKGYRLDHLAGRAVIDSRAFQIFEGPNDILYQQISASIIKQMNKINNLNLYNFLSNYKLTHRAAMLFKKDLNFNLNPSISQREQVDLGKILGRMFCIECIYSLFDAGFNKEMITNAIKTIQNEITSILHTYKTGLKTHVIDDYKKNSSWFQLFSV